MDSAQSPALPTPLRTFTIAAIISFSATLLILAYAKYTGQPYPYNSFLYKPNERFFDFFDYYPRFKYLHSARFFDPRGYPFTYLPSGIWLYRFFYSFGFAGSFIAYTVLTAGAILFGLDRLQKAMAKHGIPAKTSCGFLGVLLVLGSFPLIFCFERGNLEVIVAIFLAVGTWLYFRGYSYAAAIIWGIVGSVKLYPLALLGLFISNRQIRHLVTGLTAALTATILALHFAGPDFATALHGIRDGIKAFVQMYPLRYDETPFDHSLFALIKMLLGHVGISAPSILRIYTPASLIAFPILYLARIRELPFANQFVLLTTLSILLPPTSFDYTLTQMYAPFAVLVFVAIDNARESKLTWGLASAFISFALIFTPTNFLFHHGKGLAGQIKCLALMALTLQSLLTPWPSRESEVTHIEPDSEQANALDGRGATA